MEAHLVEFFKGKNLSISTVMSASVVLAEKVNSDTTLTGLQKTELVVNTLREYLKDTPELVALVEGVIPEMLRQVVSASRGAVNLKAHMKGCTAPCAPLLLCVPCRSSVALAGSAVSYAATKTPGSWRSWFSFKPDLSAVKVISPAEELKPKLEVREAKD
jgi:hypothetical protein